MVQTVNLILGALTVLGQVIAVVAVLFLIFNRKKLLAFATAERVLWFALLVASIAMAGSLFYSEFAGYDPCKLCWFQRILMYPMVFLFALGIWMRDRKVQVYGLFYSLLGVVISGYHYLLQLGVAPNLPCSAVGYSSACSQRFVLIYGYITIPMMAFTAFALIALSCYVKRISERSDSEPF